jgi:hypothetical protein
MLQTSIAHLATVTLGALTGVVLLIVSGDPAAAQTDHDGHEFGSVHFEISCSADSQQQFDRAVAMLHSFFYPETDKAFKAIAAKEPSCAMAQWGVAISQRPNPLTPPFAPTNLQQGWDAILNARAATTATPRERDWIEAMAVFFENYDTVAQRIRTARYADAMAKLHGKYPNDSEASTFYALSLLEAVDLSDKTYASQLKAAAILEQLQTTQPEHPGIPHYLIHSYDYAPIAEKGLPAARRYAALASSAPHAVHMPSHIFSTLGMWQEAIDSNIAADAANVAYARSVNPATAANPAAIAARYHALDFLTNAYLQLAQDNRAKGLVDQRNSLAVMPAGERITNHTAYAAIPVRYAIERGAWAEAAALPPMTTPYKEAEAIVRFGRALGAARSRDPAAARKDLAELARLQQEIAATGDPYWAEQVGIQQAAATAWIAHAEKRTDQAITAMQEAADREDRTEKSVAMENRLSPMRELLGELLLEAGKPGDALVQFERSLETVPKRVRSLDGAARAAAQSGDRTLAVSYFEQLLTLTASADTDRPVLRAAREYVEANGRPR